jgi:monoamine oxidase
VVLGAPVHMITRTEELVTVETDDRAWQARRVIVAVPPSLAGRIGYAPPLPAMRDQLTQRMPMGNTVKCVAVYERAFWRDAGFSGEALSDGPVTVVFDDTSHDEKQPALLGFIVGAASRDWSARPESERRTIVLAAFTRYFGSQAATPLLYVEKDWADDPWTRGCPTATMPPGTMSRYAASLREPVGRLHWAGTETSTEWCGYMEGAVASGERAAAEVLAGLPAVAKASSA